MNRIVRIIWHILFVHFRCYPINTVLADPYQLDQKLRDYYSKIFGSQCNSDDGSSSDDSDSDSDSDSECSDSSNVRISFINFDFNFLFLKELGG